MNKSAQDIVVEQILNTSIKDVWNVITKLEEMKQWFFNNIPSFKPEVGFKVSFPLISRNNTFTHLWEILEVNLKN